jgi:hypothetical protein
MQLPEPFPRRRRWPMFLPFVLLVALAVLWTGGWFFAASLSEATIAGWREREARAGRDFTCERQTVGGYPFRIEVRCVEPAAQLRDLSPPVALKARDLIILAQVYQPTLLISELTGPLTITDSSQAPNLVANWTLGQLSMRGTPAAPERVSLVLDQPKVESSDGGITKTVFKAQRSELHGRIVGGSVTDNPVVDVALRLTAATAPDLHKLTAEPLDADILAVLRGLADFAPKPWPARFKEMQARGGSIEITRARFQQGEIIATGSGVLGLTARGGLDGQVQITIVGLDKVLQALDINRLVSEGRVGSAIGALDRIMPGLGQIARQNAAPGIVAGLGAMGQATLLEGKPAVTLPLRFADGAILLGPVSLGRTPPLF